eukprot:482914_1
MNSFFFVRYTVEDSVDSVDSEDDSVFCTVVLHNALVLTYKYKRNPLVNLSITFSTSVTEAFVMDISHPINHMKQLFFNDKNILYIILSIYFSFISFLHTIFFFSFIIFI